MFLVVYQLDLVKGKWRYLCLLYTKFLLYRNMLDHITEMSEQ
jgi:hypothetical protein